MKANLLFKENVSALLVRDHLDRKDLAQWCRRSESWISKIFKEDRRAFPIRYYDRIADMFGLKAYQLFQPGISRVTERRLLERRTSGERRIGPVVRGMQVAAAEVAMYRPKRKDAHVVVAPSPSPAVAELKRLIDDFEHRASRLLERAATGGQAPDPRRTLAATPARRRVAGGSDPPKPER